MSGVDQAEQELVGQVLLDRLDAVKPALRKALAGQGGNTLGMVILLDLDRQVAVTGSTAASEAMHTMAALIAMNTLHREIDAAGGAMDALRKCADQIPALAEAFLRMDHADGGKGRQGGG